jgi:hypothetical protein
MAGVEGEKDSGGSGLVCCIDKSGFLSISSVIFAMFPVFSASKYSSVRIVSIANH